MKSLTNQQLQWIQANELRFITNTGWPRDTIQQLFEIYSYVDNKTHKPTGCSRCVATARDIVYKQYKKQL